MASGPFDAFVGDSMLQAAGSTSILVTEGADIVVAFGECAHKLALPDGTISNAFFAKDRNSTAGIDVTVTVTNPAALLGKTVFIEAMVVDATNVEPVHADAIVWRHEGGGRLLSERPQVSSAAPCFRGRVHIWHPRASASPLGHRRYTQFCLVVQGLLLDGDASAQEVPLFRSEPSYPFVWQVKVSAHTPLLDEGAASSSESEFRSSRPLARPRLRTAGKRSRLNRPAWHEDDDEMLIDRGDAADVHVRNPSPLLPLVDDLPSCAGVREPLDNVPVAIKQLLSALYSRYPDESARITGRELLQLCMDVASGVIAAA